MRELRRYSEAFKQQVVADVASGRFGTPFEAGRAYGIKHSGTVAYWIRRYGKNHLLGKVVHIMKADEQSETKRLRQRVKDLERALADAHLDLTLERAYLRVACRSAGITDVEGFKKKNAGAR